MLGKPKKQTYTLKGMERMVYFAAFLPEKSPLKVDVYFESGQSQSIYTHTHTK